MCVCLSAGCAALFNMLCVISKFCTNQLFCLVSSLCFRLDKAGELVQVFFGFFNRDSRLELDPHTARLFFKAFHRFGQLCAHRDFQFRYRLMPGEMVVFDNRRIVHGRVELNAAGGAVRLLDGGYMTWDDVLSRMRVLHSQLYAHR